ncbi:hypothetical protein [Nonomuraea wenchangensis]|uniref:Uncharacterized protein n=1 Tax=Nonomuraea wenchangensis TaxID=568860 RepID=A0A1I0EV83_9ACTN|nr:hypothetical protein [Nonomuraea wenchangensis]SET49365.1 hypothetical protein SAMN05421811_103216 [Nonomuraea wenchangensis]
MEFCNHDGVTIEWPEYGLPTVTYAAPYTAFPRDWLNAAGLDVAKVEGDRITVLGNVVYEVVDWHHRCSAYGGDAEFAYARLVSRPPQAGDAEKLLNQAVTPRSDEGEELTLDDDWDAHLREGEWPDRYRGAVLMPGRCGCCGRLHEWDYTPAKARRIAARLIELADEAEKVEPARLLTPEEADAR